jgi:hypothetical protein
VGCVAFSRRLFRPETGSLTTDTPTCYVAEMRCLPTCRSFDRRLGRAQASPDGPLSEPSLLHTDLSRNVS